MGGRGQLVLGWDSEAGRYVVRMNSQRACRGRETQEGEGPTGELYRGDPVSSLADERQSLLQYHAFLRGGSHCL